jgi:hypothetical protein
VTTDDDRRLEAALIKQMVYAMEVDGSVGQPFAMEAALLRVNQTVAVFNSRSYLEEVTPEDEAQADLFAEFSHMDPIEA